MVSLNPVHVFRGVNGKAELSLFPVTNVNRMRLNGKKWKVYSSESSIILKDKDVISICDEEIVFHAQPEKASEVVVESNITLHLNVSFT